MSPISNFMEIHPEGVALIHADGWISVTKVIGAFATMWMHLIQQEIMSRYTNHGLFYNCDNREKNCLMRYSPHKPFIATWSPVIQYKLPQRYQNRFNCSTPFFHTTCPYLSKPCTGCSKWENNEKLIHVYICKNEDHIK